MKREFLLLLLSLLGLLVVASIIGWVLHRRVQRTSAKATVANLNARIKSWWVMGVVFAAVLHLGHWTTVALFGLLSFLALREFITLTPTRTSDHRPLFWIFFIITPLQYLLVGIQWTGLAAIFIPVYAFIFIPIRKALAGDTEDFLATTARMQWALLVCVYFVSHMPMLPLVPIEGYEGNRGLLLFFFVFTAQASDVFQYIWGKLLGNRPIVPKLSPNKTWAGFLGGIGTTVIISSAIWWATPFTPWQAGLMALVICLAGFAGGLVMSAVKRDLGAKDWGGGIPGHGGFMDRLDSLCFAAPLFFHLVTFYFSTGERAAPPEAILRLLGAG